MRRSMFPVCCKLFDARCRLTVVQSLFAGECCLLIDVGCLLCVVFVLCMIILTRCVFCVDGRVMYDVRRCLSVVSCSLFVVFGLVCAGCCRLVVVRCLLFVMRWF